MKRSYEKEINDIGTTSLVARGTAVVGFIGKAESEKENIGASESGDNTNTTVRLTRQVMDFLTKRYDFRYNLLTEETEFRPAGQRDFAFLPVGKRNLNAFCIEAHAEGIPCWDKDLSRYIYSTYIPDYHPFQLYMEELPQWDGVDRLTQLALRFPTVRIGCRDFTSGCWGLPRSGRGWQAYMPTVWRLFL